MPADAMDALDLRQHAPAQFAGTSLELGARQYVVGPLFRDGSQGYSHFLNNSVSGLCLHLLQIRPEYRAQPADALAASRIKEQVTARLRTSMRLDGGKAVTDPMTVHETAGGSVELHEIPWCVFGTADGAPGRETLLTAQQQAVAGDLAAAVDTLDHLLQQQPNHTEALNLLANVLAVRGDCAAADMLMARAISIEPHCLRYRAAQLDYSLAHAGQRHSARHFAELKARWPLQTDCDAAGIQAFFVNGDPQAALALLHAGGCSAADIAGWQSRLEQAIAAKAAFEAAYTLPQARTPGVETPGLDLTALGALHAAYPAEPMIAANLGCLVRAAGDYRRARELLLAAAVTAPAGLVPYCWANAAFCAIELAEWPLAMQLLDMTMHVLERADAAPMHCDVPGVVTRMLADGQIWETQAPSGAEYLRRALADCPDHRLITPHIEEYARLSEHFAAAFAAAAPLRPPPRSPWWRRWWPRRPPREGA